MKSILETINIKNIIKNAHQKLLRGELVIFPTETVYGIGADATKPKAVQKIYDIKNRPYHNPSICHFVNLQKIEDNFEINELALKLADTYWPGPLTLILKKKKSSKISSLVSNDNNLVGCRIPSHPIANKLLQSVPFPIAAPSANISTKLSSTNINHLDTKLKDNVFIIDGGPSTLGLESTVINLSSDNPQILRYGSITVEQIKKIIPKIDKEKEKEKKSNQLSPGQQIKHYSPNISVRINVNSVLDGEVLLNFGKNHLSSKLLELNLSPSGNLNEAGKNFYDYLHQLDNSKFGGIAVAPIPDNDLGKTINDRLKRSIEKK